MYTCVYIYICICIYIYIYIYAQSLDNWYTRQYDNYQSLQNAVKNIFFW